MPSTHACSFLAPPLATVANVPRHIPCVLATCQLEYSLTWCARRHAVLNKQRSSARSDFWNGTDRAANWALVGRPHPAASPCLQRSGNGGLRPTKYAAMPTTLHVKACVTLQRLARICHKCPMPFASASPSTLDAIPLLPSNKKPGQRAAHCVRA